jgi:hypothetical protein
VWLFGPAALGRRADAAEAVVVEQVDVAGRAVEAPVAVVVVARRGIGVTVAELVCARGAGAGGDRTAPGERLQHCTPGRVGEVGSVVGHG